MIVVIILAIVQGLTEFIPVSSDGHLVLAGYLLGAIDQRFLDFVIFLHAGSLLVLLIYYRNDLWALATRTLGSHPDTPELRNLAVAIIVATGVTGVIGLLVKDTIEQWQDPWVAAVGLLFTGAELLSLYLIRMGSERRISIPVAILVALFQCAALLPGVSRSGSTIAVGLWMGLTPAVAARFSFLLAIPAIGGALLLELRHFSSLPVPASQLLVGFVVCTLVSWIALKIVLRFAEQGRISRFGWYCVVLGGAFLIYLAAAVGGR